MVKVSKKYHIRKKGRGKRKLRKNPKKQYKSKQYKSVVKTMHLENHAFEGGVQHHKFYEMKLLRANDGNYYVTKKWGRMGSRGQQQQMGPFSSEYDADAKFQLIEDSKRAKGYF